MVKQVVGCAAAAVVMTGWAMAQVPDAAAGVSEEQMRARQRVATMEAVLERAVSSGADNVIFQVRSIIGDQPILLTAPRARGFRLDGYGMFFDVEVPTFQLPILWPVRHLMVDGRAATEVLAEFRLLAAQLEDPVSRERVRNLIAKLEAQSPAPVPPMTPRNVAAASIAPETAPPTRRAIAAPAAPPQVPALEDPQEEYRKQVKAALIDAMLEYSQSLPIGPDEWLTVAARRNVMRDPLLPGDSVDTTTWVARVKGSVLADLRAQRITPADARNLVEQREQ